jgi:hypothetical protein
MTKPRNQVVQKIVVPDAQRDALANAVMIAWARARDRRHSEEYGIQPPVPPIGLIEEIDQDPPARRFTGFEPEAVWRCGEALDDGVDLE